MQCKRLTNGNHQKLFPAKKGQTISGFRHFKKIMFFLLDYVTLIVVSMGALIYNVHDVFTYMGNITALYDVYGHK